MHKKALASIVNLWHEDGIGDRGKLSPINLAGGDQ